MLLVQLAGLMLFSRLTMRKLAALTRSPELPQAVAIGCLVPCLLVFWMAYMYSAAIGPLHGVRLFAGWLLALGVGAALATESPSTSSRIRSAEEFRAVRLS